MPCDTTRKPKQTQEERIREVRAALQRLEAQILAGSVKVVVGPQGAVAFAGWQDRDSVTDVCAYRMLTALRSNVLTRAVAMAETLAGRKVSMQAVGQGVHSHDGGRTWGRH